MIRTYICYNEHSILLSLLHLSLLFLQARWKGDRPVIDPITTTAVALLTPYFAKAGEEIAQKAGDAVWEMATSLYHAIKQKFTRDQDSYAQQTLQRLEEQPTNEARQIALADILNEKIQADPSFAQELKQLVQKTTQTQGVTQFLTQVYDQAQVNKIINIGQLGTAQF